MFVACDMCLYLDLFISQRFKVTLESLAFNHFLANMSDTELTDFKLTNKSAKARPILVRNPRLIHTSRLSYYEQTEVFPSKILSTDSV